MTDPYDNDYDDKPLYLYYFTYFNYFDHKILRR